MVSYAVTEIIGVEIDGRMKDRFFSEVWGAVYIPAGNYAYKNETLAEERSETGCCIISNNRQNWGCILVSLYEVTVHICQQILIRSIRC